MTDRAPFPEPSPDVSDAGELALRHLEHLRGAALANVAGLPEAERRGSRVPSGWAPLELLWHLVHVERRWVDWGFLAEAVPDPWGDHDPETGAWRAHSEVTMADVEARVAAQAVRTREVVTTHPWDEQAKPGGRFVAGGCPTLGSICLHVLQEWARHVGHLDVAAELAGGAVGE